MIKNEGEASQMMDWSTNFSVDFKEMDKQHKILISIINEAMGLIRIENCNFSTMYEVVTKMDDYMVEHFGYEEKIMLVYSYPEMEEHVRQHNQFRYDLNKFNIFDVTQPRQFIEEALDYLMNWLLEHIMKTDKHLGAYMNQLRKES